jgi:hypothetical protein
MKLTYQPTEQEMQAINIIKSEKEAWERGTVWVTDKVAFEMRDVVKKARKNYFGIFDTETDPTTGRRKLFIPLTEWTVENMLKNIDIDSKEVNIKAKNQKGVKVSRIARYVLRHFLEDIGFGKLLNTILRNVVIDGTCFVKTWRDGDNLKTRVIDRLNMIYDPSSFEESSGIIERNVLTVPEFQEYDWKNTEFVEGIKSVDRTGFAVTSTSTIDTQVPYVEVFERYGYFPKFILTGKEKDKDIYTYGVIIISMSGSRVIFHEAKEVEEHPYSYFKFKDILNRADGRGIPEMLFSIQAYLNEIINIRLNTSRVVQSGFWHAQGNITPQQIKKFFQTGVIKTDAQTQFNRLDTGTISESSYKDEDQAYQWSQRVTQTQREDDVVASKPATNALIEERGSAKGYDLIMENLKMSLAQMISDKFLPIIRKIIKKGDIIRITGDISDLRVIDEELVRNYVYAQVNQMKTEPNGQAKIEKDLFTLIDQGMTLEEAEKEVVQSYIKEAMDELQKMGEDRYVELSKFLFDTEYDIQVTLGDEQVNRAIVMAGLDKAVNTLITAGVPISMLKDPLAELFDVMGLDGDKLVSKIDEAEMEKQKQAQLLQEQQQQQQAPTGIEQLPGAEANAVPKEANMVIPQ